MYGICFSLVGDRSSKMRPHVDINVIMNPDNNIMEVGNFIYLITNGETEAQGGEITNRKQDLSTAWP
jgi:hypothetical protein